MPSIRISNVVASGGRGGRRDNSVLVRELGLHWSSGERLGLTGPSGCGKTTLLRTLVNGALPSGLCGLVERDLDSDVKIAYCPQRGGLFPWYSLRRQLSEWAGANQHSESMLEIADAMGLIPQIDRFPDELSGGEYQRALLGRTLMTGGDLHILDEPCMAVDISSRWHVLDVWNSSVARTGAAAIIVGHEVDMLAYLCDRVIVIGKNRLEAREIVVSREPGPFRSVAGSESFLAARTEIIESTQ